MTTLADQQVKDRQFTESVATKNHTNMTLGYMKTLISNHENLPRPPALPPKKNFAQPAKSAAPTPSPNNSNEKSTNNNIAN